MEEVQSIGEVFESINPYTKQKLAKFDSLKSQEIQEKIEQSWSAFKAWKQIALSERLEKISKFATILEENKEEIAQVVTQEVGKTITGSRREVFFAVDAIRKITPKAEEVLKPEITEMEGKIATTHYQPLGPIYSIQPWNFPVAILIYTNIQALIAGNTVLVKPAPRCPRTVLLIQAYFKKAGLDNGQFQVLMAGHSMTNLIIGHPKVRGVNFTGSTNSGRNIAKISAEHLKKCVLELGGSDPFIVLDDADLSKAVNMGVMLRLVNCGQNCMSPKRMLAHSKIYDQFKGQVIARIKGVKSGDPGLSETTTGIIARHDLLEQLKSQVKETLEAGATLSFGDQKNLEPKDPKSTDPPLFDPIVLENISPENPGYKYQFFGPVFCLYSFDTDSEAIQIANGIDYGLGASIFSENKTRSQKMAEEIEAGVVNINTLQVPNILIPFGGVKGSGLGRQGGREGFHEFTNVKTITCASE